jgi:ABC-type sugar transport system permease subunit
MRQGDDIQLDTAPAPVGGPKKAPPQEPVRKDKTPGRRKDRGKYPFIIGFLAAPVLLYAVFVIGPYLQAFQISLTDWRGLKASSSKRSLKFSNPMYSGAFSPRQSVSEIWNAWR